MSQWDTLGAIRRILLTALAAVLVAICSKPAMAQELDSPVSPSKMPRPDYDYDGVNIGSFKLKAEVDVRVDYNSNIFLTSANEETDFRLHIDPSVVLIKEIGSGAIIAEAHMGLRRHLNVTRENSTTYGASLNYRVSGVKSENFDATIGVSRNIERRADPETRAGPTDLPRKINAFLAEAIYSRASGRIRVTAGIGTEKYNQLAAADDDRDMTVYRASVAVGYKLASTLDIFSQIYVNRRDFRLARDFGGVDRDQNTYGIIFGVQRDIGGRLHGKMGIGIFQTEPAQVTILPPQTGLRLDGEITWIPRDRTAFNFRISRGDVATVRSGASTRVDTVARFIIDQEIRHNLLCQLSVAYVSLRYLGESRGNLTNKGSTLRLEYLLDRRTSLFTSAEYEQRSARDPIDKYKEMTFTLGITRRF